jgi:phosphate-selective porin OprO/OprP
LAAALLGTTGRLTAQGGNSPVPLAGGDGFGVRSANGDFILRIRGGIQYDARFFLNDTLEVLTDQFQLRRVRPDIQGTVYRNYDFRVYFDLAGGQLELFDVYGNIRLIPELQIRAGKMKGPVGLERLQTPFVTMFAERGFPTSLVPNRDVGAQLHGSIDDGRVEYAIGVFNGVADNAQGPGTEGDDSDAKDLNGRIFIVPFRGYELGPLAGLGFGIGATHGEQNGSAAAPSLTAYRTGGREVFFRYRSDGTPAGTTVARGTRTRIAPQATLFWRNLGVLGEYVSAEQSVARGPVTAELTNEAWQVAGSLVLTGEPTSFRGVVPESALDPSDGDWGAFELVGRVNVLEVDEATFPTFADPAQFVRKATAYAGGLNWYLNRFVRILVNYERTRFDVVTGGVPRPTEHVLLSRFQFVF